MRSFPQPDRGPTPLSGFVFKEKNILRHCSNQTKRNEHQRSDHAEGPECFEKIRNCFFSFVIEKQDRRTIEEKESHQRDGKNEKRKRADGVDWRIRCVVLERLNELQKKRDAGDISGSD